MGNQPSMWIIGGRAIFRPYPGAPGYGNLPIAAMTANTPQEDVDAAMEAGMNGFVPKPLDVNNLYRLLRELLYEGGSQ